MGQPGEPRRQPDNHEVYPHLRGAATMPWIIADVLHGISPPAWGSLAVSLAFGPWGRYIPTCVGQPVFFAVFIYLVGVYPHLRGAAYPVEYVIKNQLGISPPAWGSLI